MWPFAFSMQCVVKTNIFYQYFACSLQCVLHFSGIYPLINKVGESLSYLTVFVGLKGTKEELGIQAHNCWSYHKYEPSLRLKGQGAFSN